jgi:2-hydroxyglutarate dehydrogenase
LNSKYILTCGGLQADKIAELTGNKNPPKIVPFRGEYLLLNPKKAHMIKGNIYPVFSNFLSMRFSSNEFFIVGS